MSTEKQLIKATNFVGVTCELADEIMQDRLGRSYEDYLLGNDNDEFEIRVTDEGDKLEIWKVGYEDGNCIGYVDLVAEFNLEQMPREVA